MSGSNINDTAITRNSNDTASIFDDVARESLDEISFDFNDQIREKSWCTSSNNSSCCSLCRLSNDSIGDMEGVDASGDSAGLTMETWNDLSSHPMAAPSFAIPPNGFDSSPAAACNMPGQQQTKSCQDCFTCSAKKSMNTGSAVDTCGACRHSSLNHPVKAMPQYASKNASFLSREERLALQSLLFPASTPPQPDLLTAGFLSEGPIYSILSFLDVETLVGLRLINNKMCSLASDNSAGWNHHCDVLWSRKVRVCPNARRLLDTANNPAAEDQAHTLRIGSHFSLNSRRAAMEAYKTAMIEAKNNNELSEEDLCFDLARGSGVMWSFRFKESAGVDWTSWDPWWNNKSARKLVFMRNGSILQSYPQGRSPVVTTHNSIPLYDVFSERLIHRNGAEVIPPRIEMRWRFVSSCMDLPSRPDGAYVRITVGGRDVPTYVVRRSPNGNWGFIMESCWGLYASFDLGARAETQGTSAVGRRALRRTRNGSRWVNLYDDDDDNSAAGHHELDNSTARNVRRRPNPNMLVEDSAMTVTGVSQWREALLYNIGAVTLPEGNNALGEFDAAWRNALLLR